MNVSKNLVSCRWIRTFKKSRGACDTSRFFYTAINSRNISVIDLSKAKTEILHGELKQKRQQALEEIKSCFEKKQIAHQLKIERGDPGPAIVAYANKNNFGLLVIGSRGLNSLQEMVLGSVSHKVAKRAHCPVMIIK